MKKDDNVRILDFLPKGKMDLPPHKRRPIAQAIGEKYFTLLEIIPRKDCSFEPGEKVYIGEGLREKVDHIERRIKYDWLTTTGKSELIPVIEKIIMNNEDEFINFYNTAGVITTRQHKLEIIPRIGKRHRQDILEEREKEPFKSFDDMRERVKNIPDPVKVLAERIMDELKGIEKYHLFVPLREDRDESSRWRSQGRFGFRR